MPEDQTPGQQDPANGAPPPAAPPVQPAPTAAPPINLEDYVEKKRYDGAIQAMNKKHEELTALQGQLTTQSSEVEQLKTSLSTKDVETQTLLAQRDAQIAEFQKQATENGALAQQLQMQMLKVEVANEIGHPELVKILDTVPNVADKEALTGIMKTIAGFADEQVQAREKQLLAGQTPPVSAANPTPKYPEANNEQGWEQLLASMDPYSKEYQEALTAWGAQVHAPKK